MTAGESITVRVAEVLEACGILGNLNIGMAVHGLDFAKQLGDDFLLDPQLSFETNTGTFRQVLRHKRSAFKVELFLLSQDPHDQSRFQRRRAVELHDCRLWLPSPEDVVVTKLRWARGKDKDDVRDVMAVQRDKLDWGYIEDWCRRHSTLGLMEQIRHSLPAR